MNGTLSRFIIQDHKTEHPHFDLRLEIDGVLMSWILPKRIPTEGDEKRLAIEDRSEKIGFTNYGEFLEDGYGTGKMEVWDSGIYEIKRKDKSKIEFEAKGEKFAGKFVLLLPNWGKWYKKRLWILIKLQQSSRLKNT